MSGGRLDPEVLAPVLDTLCPMHALLDTTGHIRHAGPALRKLRPRSALDGMRLMELVELRRPRAAGSMESLVALAGKKLHFVMRDPPRTELKGVLVPLPDAGGVVLNLSFGISIVDAVRDYALTGSDFAATDLAVELLYLVEAKSNAMEELRRLNLRLDGARAQAEHLAETDKLTGLRNRRALEPVLNRVMQSGQPFAVLHLDLDLFKEINDSFGHAAGDRVLQTVAERLTAATRVDDMLIRLGGDEFLLVLPRAVAAREVARLARRLIRSIEKTIVHDGHKLRVSASIGASLSTDYDRAEPGRMMQDADTALYAAKAEGRRGFRLYTAELGRMGGTGDQTGEADPPDTG